MLVSTLSGVMISSGILSIEARCVLREGGTACQGEGGGGGYRGSGIHGMYSYLVVSSCGLKFAAEFASRIE